jgi:hypothetical protein
MISISAANHVSQAVSMVAVPALLGLGAFVVRQR